MRERNPDWSGTRLNIHDVDGAYAVLQSDSGKVFMLSSTGGACENTLPVAANRPVATIRVVVTNRPVATNRLGEGELNK